VLSVQVSTSKLGSENYNLLITFHWGPILFVEPHLHDHQSKLTLALTVARRPNKISSYYYQ